MWRCRRLSESRQQQLMIEWEDTLEGEAATSGLAGLSFEGVPRADTCTRERQPNPLTSAVRAARPDASAKTRGHALDSCSDSRTLERRDP